MTALQRATHACTLWRGAARLPTSIRAERAGDRRIRPSDVFWLVHWTADKMGACDWLVAAKKSQWIARSLRPASHGHQRKNEVQRQCSSSRDYVSMCRPTGGSWSCCWRELERLLWCGGRRHNMMSGRQSGRHDATTWSLCVSSSSADVVEHRAATATRTRSYAGQTPSVERLRFVSVSK